MFHRIAVTLTLASTLIACGSAPNQDPLGRNTQAVVLTGGPMTHPRTYAASTLLADGRVLVMGGQYDNGLAGTTVLDTTEIYNPTTNTWTDGPSMTTARTWSTAVTLKDGRVLVVGGYGTTTGPAVAEIYDGTKWTPVGLPLMAKMPSWVAAALLPDGTVFVTGVDTSASAKPKTLIYTPSTGLGSWSTGSVSADNHTYGSIAALADGTVLVVGGSNGGAYVTSAERYNPTSNTWTSAGTVTPRTITMATTLLTGDVLLVGGNFEGTFLSDVESYNPTTNKWSTLAPMLNARRNGTLITLPTGIVYAAGGGTRTAELFDPKTSKWVATDSLPKIRTYPASALVAGGLVIMAGGQTTPGFGFSTSETSVDQYRQSNLGEACLTSTDCSKGSCLASLCTLAPADAGPADTGTPVDSGSTADTTPSSDTAPAVDSGVTADSDVDAKDPEDTKTLDSAPKADSGPVGDNEGQETDPVYLNAQACQTGPIAPTGNGLLVLFVALLAIGVLRRTV